MRGFVFLSCLLSVYAAIPDPPDSARQEQTIANIRQYAAAHLNRDASLSCTQLPANVKTMTVEFDDSARRGAAPNTAMAGLVEEIFAPSSAAGFRWDHWANLNGKTLAVYAYSFTMNGKTRSGTVFADESTGAIARMTFRGVEAPAHLFCSARPR